MIAADGAWTAWSPWDNYCLRVNARAIPATRVRTCTNPPPLLGGEYCVGNAMETSSCLGNTWPFTEESSSRVLRFFACSGNNQFISHEVLMLNNQADWWPFNILQSSFNNPHCFLFTEKLTSISISPHTLLGTPESFLTKSLTLPVYYTFSVFLSESALWRYSLTVWCDPVIWQCCVTVMWKCDVGWHCGVLTRAWPYDWNGRAPGW